MDENTLTQYNFPTLEEFGLDEETYCHYILDRTAYVVDECVDRLIQCQNNGQVNQLLQYIRSNYADIITLRNQAKARLDEIESQNNLGV